jgi:hypothetical protein
MSGLPPGRVGGIAIALGLALVALSPLIRPLMGDVR